MSKSVVINNVQYADVPEVQIPVVGGGTARSIIVANLIIEQTA